MFIGMRRIILTTFVAGAVALPAAAEDTSPGRSLMEEGMRLFLDGLRDEMSPALQELQGLADELGPSMKSFVEEMGPAFSQMLDEVRDWTAYHPPEILPNGDIILRRKRPDMSPEPEPKDNTGPTDI
jgi:hypothetical protein